MRGPERPGARPGGLILDAGALIAFDRNRRHVVVLLARALEHGWPIAVPAGALAQAWRDGQQQTRLARLLRSRSVTTEPLDDRLARKAGQLCGARRTADVIDATVVLSAQARNQVILTSDAADLQQLDPLVRIVAI